MSMEHSIFLFMLDHPNAVLAISAIVASLFFGAVYFLASTILDGEESELDRRR